jgi:uncharacterized protein (DUF885 family)
MDETRVGGTVQQEMKMEGQSLRDYVNRQLGSKTVLAAYCRWQGSRARLASDRKPLSHDEDVRYYLKHLEDVAKLFDEFTPGRSRQGRLL